MKHSQTAHATGDPLLDVIGAIVRRALLDARRDKDAAEWVENFLDIDAMQKSSETIIGGYPPR